MIRLGHISRLNKGVFPRSSLGRSLDSAGFKSLPLTGSARGYSSEKSDDPQDKRKPQQKDVGAVNEPGSVSNVKSAPPKSAPAPLDNSSGIANLMKKDVKPYIPKLKHERVSYEYPGLPNEDDFTKHSNKVKKPEKITRWTRHVPKILTAVVVLWGAYVVKVWYFAPEESSDSTDLLSPDEFHRFIVTHKKQIDDDHYLIEVRPKYNTWQYSYYAHYENKSIWNGNKLWSVEIKQPQIMVVRSYTPLPLYFMKSERTRSGEKEPLLRVVQGNHEDYDMGGVMTFYVKRYGNGEVSRYITDKKVGDELEIRGPQVEYKFPHHPLNSYHERPTFKDLPSRVEAETLLKGIKKEHNLPEYDNVDFYAAGTGIAPVLQSLFSRNPYRGYINVHYSAKSDTELGPLRRFIFFLEKLDRVKFIEHINGVAPLSKKDIQTPAERHYVSPLRQELEPANSSDSSEPSGNAKSDLELRMAIMNGTEEETPRQKNHVEWYENALEQAQVTSLEKKEKAALAVVCGPDGYVDYVAGGKILNTGEQGPVSGLLGAKEWTSNNVFKL